VKISGAGVLSVIVPFRAYTSIQAGTKRSKRVHKSPIGLCHTFQLILFLVKAEVRSEHYLLISGGQLRTLIAYEFDDPFAALINSSAKHSAIDLTLRKADSRVCRINMRSGRTSDIRMYVLRL